jgi:hypothetical protein
MTASLLLFLVVAHRVPVQEGSTISGSCEGNADITMHDPTE